MKKVNKLLLNGNETKIMDAPEPQEILLPLKDFDMEKEKLKIKEGTRIITGEQIIPGFYSTVTGTLKNIESLLIKDKTFTALRIEVSEEDEFDPNITQEADFMEKDPEEILKKLNRANLGFCKQFDKINIVIVSAVDTEPLVTVNQQILRENKEIVSEGLKLIKHLTQAKKIILAVPEYLYNLGTEVAGDLADVFFVKPYYPNGLPEILTQNIGSKYDIGNSLFLKIEKLIASVFAIKEGKPFISKVISISGNNGVENYRVRIGTLLKELLKDIDIKDNEKVIVGGPLKGFACYDTEFPIGEDIDCVYVQKADEVVHKKNRQCINCGKCVRVCPVNLDVNLISRFAEFSIFEKCEELEVTACFECGLCAYYCPSDRSLVQFLHFAKKEIEKIKEAENIEGEVNQ